jgi:hypothetical protein
MKTKATLVLTGSIDENAVALALQKLETAESTSTLTLEEVIMCYHKKSCIRVPETWNSRFKRGSTLVYPDIVVMVANPDDEHLIRCGGRRMRFIGPQREFGVMPGSRFYTRECYVMVCKDAEEVRDWRLTKQARDKAIEAGSLSQGSRLLSPSLMSVRCPEESGLKGRLAGQRFKRARFDLYEGAD